MAEQGTGYGDVAMRIGVFCRADGSHPVSTGWPFGRLTYGNIGVVISAPGIVSAAVRRRFAWADVVRAEQTPRGVRFRFGDRASSIVVGTPSRRDRRRLVDTVRRCCPDGVVGDGDFRLRPWRWDPDA